MMPVNGSSFGRTGEAAAHLEADLRAVAGRAWVSRRDHDREGLRARGPPAAAGDVRAVAPRSWARPGRLRRGAGRNRRRGAEDPLLCHGPPHSDGCFVQAYPAETTEAFCAGHDAAFSFFGGVPRSILYDNTKLAVARILGDGRRQRTRVFSELQSHYLFADRFGRPGKGNDKGKVEGLIGLARRNYLVPIPRAADFDALNARLLEDCRRRLGDRLRGHQETIGERIERDRAAFLSLPPAPYDACEKKPAQVSSLSLVRYRRNDTRCRRPMATARSWSAA